MNEELRQVAEAVKDPASYHWLTYLWVVVMSGWGGLVRFLNAMKGSRTSAREAFWNLFAGLCTSTFVGVITFYACELANFDKLATAICICITGHMGSAAINVIQSGVVARLRAAWVAAFEVPKE